MIEPVLKSNWERRHDHIKIDLDTAQKLIEPHTHEKITSLKLLPDGCANTNFKLTLADNSAAVLRIYLRDQSALGRELGILHLIENVLPVPEIYYADSTCSIYPFPYAMSQWIDGTLLRDLIFTNNEEAISSSVFDAGINLSILRAMKLPYGGFFQEDMQIRSFAPEEQYEPYIFKMLSDKSVAESLGNNLMQEIQQIISQCCHLLPEVNEANLTHGDYDPANILVHQVKGQWKVAAILDWEFAFSGSYLFDIGLMLRYSHKLPDYFETSFISGIEDSGPKLPSDWKISAKLADLLCLLQLLQQNPQTERPHLHRDVIRLITHMIKILPGL